MGGDSGPRIALVSRMSARTREEHYLRTHWTYPTDVEGVLKALGTSLDDRHQAEIRVDLFMLFPVARVMRPELRRALRTSGLLPPARSYPARTYSGIVGRHTATLSPPRQNCFPHGHYAEGALVAGPYIPRREDDVPLDAALTNRAPGP
jgi:hypothetical protein